MATKDFGSDLEEVEDAVEDSKRQFFNIAIITDLKTDRKTDKSTYRQTERQRTKETDR